MEIIQDRLPQPPPNSYLAVDLEIFGLNPKQIHRPTSGEFACCSFCYEPGVVYLCTDAAQIPDYLRAIDKSVWLMHNAKFDVTHLRRWGEIPQRGRLVDTMLIERILWNGWYDLFGLDSVVRRYLDEYLDKGPQKEFEKARSLTPGLIEYAAKDADADLRVWNAQKTYLTTNDFTIYKTIDLPVLWAVMDFQGIRLDVDKWKTLAEANLARRDEIDATLPFNPRSPKQVVKYLGERGFKGLDNAQAETLEEMVQKHPNAEATKYAVHVLESKRYGTMASRYGMKFIENYLEKEDSYHIIVASYNITAAETGRMSASDPGMQQIPSRGTKEFRKCFIPRPGNALLVADYSAQEPRITAYMTGDRRLKEIFRRHEDVYIASAKEVFGKTIVKGDPLRDRMKSTFLGIDYGMSPMGLALREGIKKDEAEALLEKFFKVFPDVSRWVEAQKKKTRLVTTVSGRKCWLNAYSDQCERNALNSPIQGTAADMMKKALATMHQEWNFDYPFACVGVVHDEVLFDVPEKLAPQVQSFICNTMVQTGEEMCKGIPFEADVKICSDWSQKG